MLGSFHHLLMPIGGAVLGIIFMMFGELRSGRAERRMEKERAAELKQLRKANAKASSIGGIDDANIFLRDLKAFRD